MTDLTEQEKEALNEKVKRAIAQLDRGEGIPGEEFRARIAADRAAWLAEHPDPRKP